MHGMVNIAVRAARRAGEIMVRQLNQLESLRVIEHGFTHYHLSIKPLLLSAVPAPGV